ncbi:MAG: M15 family metallopeptidase [Alphaproteobacteria bacterium]|nr:M15 family metallopeptidase [Alphaproteobacteria bacterium]
MAILVTAPAPAEEGRAAAAAARPQGVFAFIAAYPDHLDRVEKGVLYWLDGTKMPLARLGLDRHGRPLRPYRPADDPATAATEAISAIDYEPIYLKIYGDCRTGDMTARLATLRWNRAAPDGGDEVRAAAANGVAAIMQRISDELDRLPDDVAAARRALGGTYNCRNIALTDRLSLHGFGIAIDLNPTHDGYWLTAAADANGEPVRRNRLPMAIVAAFERRGFVWGGRWNRFDTFHFEYRPEYLVATGGKLPERLTRPTFSAYFGGHVRTAGQWRFTGAGVERMSYRPRPAGAPACHRWVRQPGRDFGRCLAAPASPRRKGTR